MDLRVPSKEITIADKKYEIRKVDPRTACWMFAYLGSKGPSISLALGSLSRAEFAEIQAIALKNCFFLDNKEGHVFPTAVLSPNGQIAEKELNESPDSVYRLTLSFISFNFEPFLDEDGSNSQSPNQN